MQVARVRWVVATAVVTATVVPLSSAITTVTIRSMPFLWFLRRIERAEGIFSQPLDVSVCAFATATANASILLKIRICFVFDTNGWTMNEAGKYFILYFYLFFKGHVNVDAITHSSRSTYIVHSHKWTGEKKMQNRRLPVFVHLIIYLRSNGFCT